MTAFDRAWGITKIVPELASSGDDFRNRYREITGDEYGEEYLPEGYFLGPRARDAAGTDGSILMNLPGIAMGSSFNMINDAGQIEDMEGFEEMLSASGDVSHPLFEQRFIKDFIRNYQHEMGHALTMEEVERWSREKYYRNHIARTKRKDFQRAWESLAHILQDPHDPNWRESMRWHTEVGEQ